MTGCSYCDNLPQYQKNGTYDLYVNPQIPHTLGKIKKTLESLGHEPKVLQDQLVHIPIEAGSLEKMAKGLITELSSTELNQAVAFIQPSGEPVDSASLAKSEPLSNLLGKLKSEWLTEIMDEKRLTTHFQPIVANDNEHIFGYECLLRAYNRNRELLSPAEVFGAATSTELLYHLDREARLTAIDNAHQHKIKDKIFINFNPNSIYDPVFCLRTTCAKVQEVDIANEQIVFEVVESEEIDDNQHLTNIIDYYRQEGFRVALDDLGSGFNSLKLINTIRPDFIKLDMELIRNIDSNDYKKVVVENLINIAHKLDIATIGEGIETQQERDVLSQLGTDYLQGFYFGKPQAKPASSS